MPGLLTSKLPEGWERSETINGIPYYINHETEKTQWDHPEMVEMLEEIEKMNNIKYAAYRTAMKLRLIQKKTQLFMMSLPVLVASFDEEGLRDGHMEGNLSAAEVSQIILTVFLNQNGDRTDFIDVSLASELTLNWILNIYDPGRSGYIQVLSLKVGLSLLCSAKLQDKYRYIFRQLCNTYSYLDKGRLKLFLQETLQIPKFIYESTAFSGTSVEPAIRNCFERVSIPERVSVDEFLEWMIAEPQTIVWLPTLHRLSVSETVKHESRCNVCKMYPIIGFRYRCLKCFNFDLCQQCFWSGSVNKSHKIGHPTQEYCLASTQKEDIKDFAKVMKNKVSTKKKKNKAVLDPSKGRYIPISPEDMPSDAEEDSPRFMDSPDGLSPTKASYQSSLGKSASRLSDHEEQKEKLCTPGPDIFYTGNTPSMSQSPDQLTQPLSQQDKEDLEILITSLESENRALHSEIEKIHHLKTSQMQVPEQNISSEEIAETSFLRQQQERLQAREEVLEEHNRQLQIQLHRLRVLLQQEYIPQNISLPSSVTTLSTSSLGPSSLNKKNPQTTSLQQSREFMPSRSTSLIYPAPHRQHMSTPYSHVISASAPDTTALHLSSPPNLSHPARSYHLMSPTSSQERVPAPNLPGVSLSMPLKTTSSRSSPVPFPGRHAVSLPQVVPIQMGGSTPLGSSSVGEQGSINHPVSLSEELELDSIVERMTTAFPLNVQSDMPVEIHGDLFLAASLVGDGMQSMVTEVSRKTGGSRKISGASSASGRDSVDELCGQDFGQDSHA